MSGNRTKGGGASGPLHPRSLYGPRRIGWVVALLLLPLTLGLTNAQGSTLSVSTVTVEVIGKGEVTSAPAGLDCGNGRPRATSHFPEAEPPSH